MEEKYILVFAHRGDSKEFPENTMPAFEKAAELGADFIETDVHLTRDKKFVVIHDESIDRVTNGTGKVADYAMNELNEFDAGYNFTQDQGKTYPYRGKGITLISLDELLVAFPGIKFNIDLKDKNPEQIKYFIDVVNKYKAYNRIIGASEHCSNLRTLRKMEPGISTSFSISEVLGILFLYRSGLLFLKNHFKGIALQIPEIWGNFNVVTRSFVKQMHEKYLQVHVWTVNKEEDMRRLIDMGIDGIMSDDPALLLKVLGR